MTGFSTKLWNTIQTPQKTIHQSNNPTGFVVDIYSEIISALESEERVMLATIISTSGSTPASAFSKMLIKNSGTGSVGTVGGGCLEADVLEAAKRLYASEKAEILTFKLNEDEFVQGLICGGNLEVLVEPVSQSQVGLIRRIHELRIEGEDTVLATGLRSDATVATKNLILAPKENVILSPPRADEESEFNQILRFAQDDMTIGALKERVGKAFARNETQKIKCPRGELILEPIAGTPGLILFGGGHVSRSISKAASLAGFRVTVVDDRSQYANPERFPEASKTLVMDFHEAVDSLRFKPSTYVLIVTRGHRSDEETLEQVVQKPAKYIGMIGSKRKVLTTFEHLMEHGISEDDVKRVHAPVGLEIGATTAEEIGISIVAQLIAVRRGETPPYTDKSEALRNVLRKNFKTAIRN